MPVHSTSRAVPDAAAFSRGQLTVRPSSPTRAPPAPGAHRLGIVPLHDSLLYVPHRYRSDRPAPLLVSLHGAGGDAQHGLSFVEAAAERWGFLVLAPQSRRPTWDVIQGGFGPDVANLDLSLRAVFAALNVDPRHLAIGGFSDGASYALSLGLTNGALFDHVLAFSPGFASPGQAEGKPHIFISHGTLDAVLPIERCSRRLAPALTRAGLEVDYVEFVGPHTVPERMVERAVTGWLGPAVTLPSGRT